MNDVCISGNTLTRNWWGARARTNRRAPTHSRARANWEHIARQDSRPPSSPSLLCPATEIMSYLNLQTAPLLTGGGGRGGGNRTPAVITALAHLSKHTELPPRLDSLCFTPPPHTTTVIIPSVFALTPADDHLPRGRSPS